MASQPGQETRGLCSISLLEELIQLHVSAVSLSVCDILIIEKELGPELLPSQRYTGPLSLVPQNVALVEDKVFTHVIKLR
jgi:hypothetical protein